MMMEPLDEPEELGRSLNEGFFVKPLLVFVSEIVKGMVVVVTP
jgi:hypothetical protein